MSYHRSKQASDEHRRYEEFRAANINLIQEIGLPGLVYEEMDNFVYFLMHGALWPDAPVRFNIAELESSRYELWKLLADKYFEAGFCDPGLCAVSYEERKALARKYPRQFGDWLCGTEASD